MAAAALWTQYSTSPTATTATERSGAMQCVGVVISLHYPPLGPRRRGNRPALCRAAEQAELTVLHYDADFDPISTVTEQAV